MHMNPIQYRDFCVYSEMICELQKRLLLEKVIYMSIAFFTIATELRFLHFDRIERKREETSPETVSEFYHLKAIEMACKHIVCGTPYINHLITSYHKHYKQNLDTIVITLFNHLAGREFFSKVKHWNHPQISAGIEWVTS